MLNVKTPSLKTVCYDKQYRIKKLLHIKLKFVSEASDLKEREKQRLEAAEIKFLRHLLRITKLDKEKN
jgi:hypothetical protein